MFFDPESINGLNPDRAGLLTLEIPMEVIAKRIEYDPLPENHACVATYIGERMIARAAIPEDLVEDFCETVSGPVYLALITFEAEPGIQGRFIAFVPMERIHKIRLKKEPWLASLPSSSSCFLTFASRRTLDVNFSCQNAGLLAGVVA